MSAWFHSLRGRITIVTVAVAVLAVLVTGLVSLQLARASTIGEARTQLAAQAQLLSRLPVATDVAEIKAQVKVALGDTDVAIIRRTGVVVGDAQPYLTVAMRQRLLSGQTLSTVARSGRQTIVIEGRPTRTGGAVVLARSQENLEKATRQSARRIILALVIGVVVAIVAGALLGRWIARPLVLTAATARRMAAGERGLPAPAHKPTEIADVSDALAGLDRALTSSEGRQREFLLSISHELRTPLTAVRGYGEAMTDGLIHEQDIARVGATLVSETERLDRFVSDLLELARLEADDFVIHPQLIEVGGLLNQVRDAWQGRCTTLGITLTVSTTVLPMRTDGRRLRQVLDGLVENALRVTPAEGAVTITADSVGPDAVIEVSDGGPGLSTDDLGIAFERGVLHARYREERPVGTGLGLSIASRLVGRLGGSIRAGAASGGGARFTVTLPK